MQRSTGKASKQRRDQINAEIGRLRDLLPLPEAVKTRLSYLHVMSLACMCIRKDNFSKAYHMSGETRPDQSPGDMPVSSVEHVLGAHDITQALPGFLLMVESSGKILHISDNVLDHLGHSAVEVLSSGGDMFELVNPADHAKLRSHLHQKHVTSDARSGEKWVSFVCRLIMSRALRRKNPLQSDSQCRAFHIQGNIHFPATECQVNREGVLFALCTPIETSGDSNPWADVNRLSTTSFSVRHCSDMRILSTCDRVPLLLGYSSEELFGNTWYQLVHPNCLTDAAEFHKTILLLDGGRSKSCSSILRLITRDNQAVITRVTGTLVREDAVNSVRTILCKYHIISGDVESISARTTEVTTQNSVSDEHLRLSDVTHRDPGVQGEDWTSCWRGEEKSYSCSPFYQDVYRDDHRTEWVQERGGVGPYERLGQSIASSRSDDLFMSKYPILQHQLKMDKSLEDGFWRKMYCYDDRCDQARDTIYTLPGYRREPRKIRTQTANYGQSTSTFHPYHDATRKSSLRPHLERVQEIVDYTYVIGRQDASLGNGNLCVLSSRRSLTHSHDIAMSLTRERSHDATPRDQLHETHRNMIHPSSSSCRFVSDTTESVDKLREASRYGYPTSSHYHSNYEDRKQSPTQCLLDQSPPSPDSTSVATQTSVNTVNNEVHNLQRRSAFYNHMLSTRQRTHLKQTTGDASTTEESRCSTGLDAPLKKGRSGSFGVKSVEDSITAALSLLSNDQIRLLDQATSSILDIDVSVEKGSSASR